MSDELYTEVDVVMISEHDGPPQSFFRARVVLNGRYASEGLAPNFGVHKVEGNARSSAIAAARISFDQIWVKDVRTSGDIKQGILATPSRAER